LLDFIFRQKGLTFADLQNHSGRRLFRFSGHEESRNHRQQYLSLIRFLVIGLLKAPNDGHPGNYYAIAKQDSQSLKPLINDSFKKAR